MSDQIVVIDEDLGLSGATAAERTGFQRLIAEVGLQHLNLAENSLSATLAPPKGGGGDLAQGDMIRHGDESDQRWAGTRSMEAIDDVRGANMPEIINDGEQAADASKKQPEDDQCSLHLPSDSLRDSVSDTVRTARISEGLSYDSASGKAFTV
jgi:hypothetical protein